MNANELKLMWHDAHSSNNEDSDEHMRFEKTLGVSHCKTISRILSDVKIKIFGYLVFFLIYLGLMIYALWYLRLHLSVYSLMPLIVAGLFLVLKTIFELNRLLILINASDTMSIKESLFFFYNKLNKIKVIDFIVYLILFYGFAIGITYSFIKDIGGINHLSWTNENLPVPILVFFILLLLFTPWFLKYLHRQRYEKLFSNLNDSIKLLEEES